MEKAENISKTDKEKLEANACMAIGAGVGAVGIASAAFTGAVCPLCILITPGLIGYGAYKRWSHSEAKQKGDKNGN